MRLNLACALAACAAPQLLAVAPCAGATGQGPAVFTGLDVPVGWGWTASTVYGLSGDGGVAAGVDHGSPTLGDAAFAWSPALGRARPILPEGATFSAAMGVSGDGLVLTGVMGGPFLGERAFRWTAQGVTDLGVLEPGQHSYGHAVNADGQVVVGYATVSPGGYHTQGFVWTPASGMQALGLLPGGSYAQALAVSAQGTVVVGYGTDASGRERPLRWVNQGAPEDLGLLPGGTSGAALGVSRDGLVIVGATLGPGGSRAFRWSAGAGLEDLGLLPGAARSFATAANDDASAIVGCSGPDGTNFPFLWTRARGMVSVQQYLAALGQVHTDWTLRNAWAVSGDGLTIGGDGFHDGRLEAWVARIPAPCGLADITCTGSPPPHPPDGQLTVDDLIDFVNLFSEPETCPGVAPCSRADVCGLGGPPEPSDGQLTVDDLIAFVNAFSAGCE